MKDGYTTLKDIGEASFTEKKSEFIGSAMPVQTEEEALEFIAEIKKKHSTARHNVYAYVVRENNIIRFTEDGEPKGTAGSMVLEVLKKSDITDAVIVVTRYFGGILLGTGGLARAYTKADAGIFFKILSKIFKKFLTPTSDSFIKELSRGKKNFPKKLGQSPKETSLCSSIIEFTPTLNPIACLTSTARLLRLFG